MQYRKSKNRTEASRREQSSDLQRSVSMHMLCVLLLALFLSVAAGGSICTANAASLSRSALSLLTGEKAVLKVSGAGRKKVHWRVKNRKIAEIKKSGKHQVAVCGKKAGATVVTVTVGKVKHSCVVTVSDESAAELESTVQWTQQWKNGTWDEEGYHSEDGTLLADFHLADAQKAEVVKKASQYPYLYIGASRTKNTARAVKDKKVYFYYCGGAGFRWFFNSTFRYGKRVEPAYAVIRTYLTRRPTGCVIIDLGGNDLSNLEAYVGFYKILLARFPRAKIWFMGVLPRAKTNPTNPARRAFDLRLEKEFPGHVINLYDWVYGQSGFKTVDGTHYAPKLSRKIYKKTMAVIGRKITVNSRTGKVKAGK